MRLGTWMALCVALLACDDTLSQDRSSDPSDEVAVVEAKLSVPPEVRCVRLVAEATGKTIRKVFPVTPLVPSLEAGPPITLSLGRLPAGPLALSGDAYAESCPTSGAAAPGEAIWSAAPVGAVNVLGEQLRIPLHFEPVRPVAVDADFTIQWVDVATNGATVMALDASGRIWAWGQYFAATPSHYPPQVPIENGTATRLEISHSRSMCIVTSVGDLYCYSSTIPLPAVGWNKVASQVDDFDLNDESVCFVTFAYPYPGQLACIGRVDGVDYPVGAPTVLKQSGVHDVGLFEHGLAYRLFSNEVEYYAPAYVFDGLVPGAEVPLAWRHDRSEVRPDGVGATVELATSETEFGACEVTHNGDVLCDLLGVYSPDWYDYAATQNFRGIHDIALARPAVQGGSSTLCGIDDEGGVRCGQSSPMERVPFTGTATKIAMAWNALDDKTVACAITDTSDIWCWGDNSSGQLGDGSYEFGYVPVRVSP